MTIAVNGDVAGRLEELARLLEAQGADRFRVRAYQQAARTIRFLPRPVSEVLAKDGVEGLESLPHVGESIARAVRDLLARGRLAMLERLRGESDPVALLASVPGIGRKTADLLHHDLGINTLEDLEAAAHDGRLHRLAGFGAKRLAGVSDSLAHRLQRIRPPAPLDSGTRPSVEELLDVDREYRDKAAAGLLTLIAPRRFNPTRTAWLPVLHTARGSRHYTALFSNTARAHARGKTSDWVVLYWDGTDGEHQCTVITAEYGAHEGSRIVRGREDEHRLTGAVSRVAS
jgi:DNA polymerase (family X)